PCVKPFDYLSARTNLRLDSNARKFKSFNDRLPTLTLNQAAESPFAASDGPRHQGSMRDLDPIHRRVVDLVSLIKEILELIQALPGVRLFGLDLGQRPTDRSRKMRSNRH